MFELLNTLHNDIDGTYCYGMLQYAGTEYGSRGQICVYRCSQCGREIRNLEESFAPAHGSSYGFPHGGLRPGGGYRDRDYGSGFGPAFGTGFNSGFNPGFGSGFGFGAEAESDYEEDRCPGYGDRFDFGSGEGGFW